MSKRGWIFGIPIAAALVATVAGSAVAGTSDRRYVQIKDGRVHPTVVRVGADHTLGWVNYSSRIATVSFEREVGKRLTCESSTSFRLTGTRLQSADIQSTQFASLCRLAPGEYRYRVDLRNGAGGAGAGARDRSFEGMVIVE